jgi:hypothetical protein
MQSKQERIEEFKNKFSDLLDEYHAEIFFTCASCSDTHGIYDPQIILTIIDPDDYRKEITVIESNGYALITN